MRVRDAADWLLVASHLMVLSFRRTVFFLLACPGMMNVLAMYLASGKHTNRNINYIKNSNIQKTKASTAMSTDITSHVNRHNKDNNNNSNNNNNNKQQPAV